MSKVLIKAQTTLDEYGAELPPKRPIPISPEEQEFNFDRAVDASSASSLSDIYNQPYDSSWAGEMIDTNVSDARQKIARDLLQGDSRKYPNHIETLENVLDHDTQSGADGGSEALPESLRQYFSRQSKLPEHMPALHTPNWQMEDGSIRPGSIPPINAVRRMGTRDIDLMMQGAGLVPVHNDGVHDFERNMIPKQEYRFNLDREGETKTMDSIDGPKEVSPNELGFFVSPNNKIDVGRAQMDDNGGFGREIPKGFVGIRGLNTKDDKLQMRPPIGNPMESNTEGLVQSRIPPSRLVPIKHKEVYPTRDNILYGQHDDDVQDTGEETVPKNYRNQIDSVINEYPEVWNDVNMPKPLRVGDAKSLHNVMGSNLYENSTPLSWGDSGRENPMVGVTPRAIENVLRKPGGTHPWDFNIKMNRHLEWLKRNKPVKKADVAVDSSREAPATLVELQNGDYAGKPEACTLCGNSPVVAGGRWKNPLGNIDYTHHLCEQCADQYDIHHSADYYKGEDMFIGDVLVKELPKHWRSYADTLEELREGMQSMRSMSLEDAQNVEDMKLRQGNIEWEQEVQQGGARSIVPGIEGGKIVDEQAVKDGGGFVYRPNLDALAPAGQLTDMPRSKRKNVLVGSFQKPDNHAGQNEGRAQTEGFIRDGMDPKQAFLLSDPTKPFIREDLLEQARVKQMGGTPHHERTDIEISPNDGFTTASQALETLPVERLENPFTEMGSWGPSNPVGGTAVAPRKVGGLWDNGVFRNSEPMSVGDVLVKERISPEAIAHKLEYDKKYESNPVRVKYREDLNRERRKRHIYGKGGPDMSHTSQNTIVPEDPHANRARHFKSKGTLL